MQKSNYILAFLLMLFVGVNGQLQKEDPLHLELEQKDKELFRAAFDTCDTKVLEQLFTEDFEFYHDKGGLTEGRETFVGRFAEGCAQRDRKAPQPAKRILVPESLEVYPLYRNGELYGAIQHGIHTFEFLNEKGEYQKGDIAKFTHVWIKDEEGRWKVRRELSYDHQSQQ